LERRLARRDRRFIQISPDISRAGRRGLRLTLSSTAESTAAEGYMETIRADLVAVIYGIYHFHMYQREEEEEEEELSVS